MRYADCPSGEWVVSVGDVIAEELRDQGQLGQFFPRPLVCMSIIVC